MLDLHHLPGSTLEEKTVLTFRRHPITLLPLALTAIVLVVLPPAAYVALRVIQPELIESSERFTLFLLGAGTFFLAGWLFIFQSFIDFWLDAFILTDKRILDIEQKGLFNRTVSELRLYRTQDVTAEVKGILHTLLDYGDIYVQTAGEEERFHFEDIPHPNHVAKMILEWSEEDRKEHLEEAVEDFGMADKESTASAANKIEP
jgi:uncharacterized membrane protein YdbT with pleckstrin-like domain